MLVPNPSVSRRWAERLAVWLAILTLVAYFVVRFRDCLLTFLFLDDFWCARAAAQVQLHSWSGLSALFRPGPTGLLLFRPLTQVGYFYVLRQLFGYDVSGYHAFHLLMHVVNAVLVLEIARALSGSTLSALAVAIIYAAAPGHGAAIYWVAAFTMTGSALIVFSMLYVWLQVHGVWRAVICFVLQALGLLASEHACVTPLLLGILALYSQPREPWRKVLRDLAPATLLVFAYLLVKAYYFYSGRLIVLEAYTPTFDAAGWVIRLGRYAVACFSGLTLLDLSQSRLFVVGMLTTLLALVAGWCTLRGSPRWRLLAIGSAVFLASLFPVLPLSHHVLDYFVGVAAIGAALSVLGICQLASRHWRWLVSAVALCFLVLDVGTSGSALRSNEFYRTVLGGSRASARWLERVRNASEGNNVTEVFVPRDDLTESLFLDFVSAPRLFYSRAPAVTLYEPDQIPSPAPGRVITKGAGPLREPLPGWDTRWDWLRRLAAGSR